MTFSGHDDSTINIVLIIIIIIMPCHCWFSCSPGRTFPDMISSLRHRLSRTWCHKHFWSATLWPF